MALLSLLLPLAQACAADASTKPGTDSGAAPDSATVADARPEPDAAALDGHADTTGTLTKKWFPGHYLYVTSFSSFDGMKTAWRDVVKNNGHFAGYKAMYFWATLEPSDGKYDFSMIIRDLNIAQADGKKLWIMILNRQFSASAPYPLPDYIRTEPVYQGGIYHNAKNHQLPKLWIPEHGARFAALFTAMGAAIDSHPALAGVQVQETSLGESQLQPGFSSAGLLQSTLTLHNAIGAAFPRTLFMQYVNWFGGLSSAQFDTIMANLVHKVRGGFGGPDVYDFNNKTPLQMQAGAYWTLYDGKAAKGVSNQGDGYKRNSPQITFETAVDTLNTNFVFWLPVQKSWSGDFKWYVEDAIDVIDAEAGRVNTAQPNNL
jgi:hypothetical protein